MENVYGDVCDDKTWICAVSALILLTVVNLSPKMNSVTRIHYMKAKLLYTYFDNFSLHSAHFCTTNLLRKIGTKFYQNRSGFVEDMIKKHSGAFFRLTV